MIEPINRGERAVLPIETHQDASSQKLMRPLFWGLALLLFVIVSSVFFLLPKSTEALLLSSRQLFKKGRFAESESLARLVLRRNPMHCQAVYFAARSAVAQHHYLTALNDLRIVRNVRRPECLDCLKLGTEIARGQGYAQDAIEFSSTWSQTAATDVEAANQLAYLLGVEGRAFESQAPLFAAIRTGKFTPHHLVMLGAGEPIVHDSEFVNRCLKSVPDDPLPLLGQAREFLSRQDYPSAETVLRRILAVHPGSQEAQARWGYILIQRGDENEFLRWNRSLEMDIWHPEIWVVRGLWYRQQSNVPVAARCFWEALRRDSNHRIACYQLGQLLMELKRTDEARACFQRASQLEKLAYLVDRIYENPEAYNLLIDASKLTEQLGRIWEAWAWATGASLADPSNRQAIQMAQRLQSILQPNMPQTVISSQLGRSLDLSVEPMPDLGLPDPKQVSSSRLITQIQTPVNIQIKFEDQAEKLGLRFTYLNGHDSGSKTSRMLESMGGGVAAIDYDMDGWSDIYLTQGGSWETRDQPGQPMDELFRNQQARSFAKVTNDAHLGDVGFSQGCAVGDINSDGFPDLYVGNLGVNRLYVNQGDGTFIDVTGFAGISGERWTTSCLNADLNGDGLPDLYDVNYLLFKDAPRSLCIKGDEARTCGPGSFHAEPDQLYLNLGDGRFRDISVESGIEIPDGKGLGIVAADFTGNGRLDLFIANDSVPNFYFVNQKSSRGEIPRFSDQALISGLALSHDGLSAAWMGVATGDANGDGRLDLFATTYADQAKSLFLQDSPGGVFTDAIIQCGLKASTYRLLGFGTQFLDADLDGWQDLVITNGHVFDLSHKKQLYQMPPQFFRNLGGGKFQEIPGKRLGAYFEGSYLGRGLARLDWNRDGRDDFVVSHMMSPAAIVTNQTRTASHFIVFRLIGVQSNREAIGTRIRIRSGDRTWTQELTAGDGYQASNERKILFGLGDLNQIEEAVVDWISGTRTVLKNLDADSEWLLIEGQTQVIRDGKNVSRDGSEI